MSSVPGKTDTLMRGAVRDDRVSGEFVDFAGERFYAIRNVEQMPPFFITLVSSDDHWLFTSSTGGLSAGRVSPDTALFPYVTDDKLHDNAPSVGPVTKVRAAGSAWLWEPFDQHRAGLSDNSRHLYKSTLGDKLCFEEVNHDLGLLFRYTWSTSAEFGFVRDCELSNIGDQSVDVEIADGLRNILPAGTPRFTQTNSSNLVDAYKWSEVDEASGLAFFTLYAGITDRAEPCESLRATTAFCLGPEKFDVLLSDAQLPAFRRGSALVKETQKRGVRGSFLVSHAANLAAGQSCTWRIVLNSEQSQSDAARLRQRLSEPRALHDAIDESIAAGTDKLARIMASADALQATAEENVAVHHYANVLFNVLRGGIFADQYCVPAGDFRRSVRHFNKPVFDRHRALLDDLPVRLRIDDLLARVDEAGDPQLQRLAREYLPITFGRRHGDPSRPWNQFAIRLKDDRGEDLLSYEGNWRDIFQNWEALALSYPAFIESMVAKFVNASTIDGYNPYRITKEGIDWEVEEPDDPWSYIGYWGDHQIIYLLKLLELSRDFHPNTLHRLLREPVFCYANVPYRIKPLEGLLADPKATVEFDEPLAAQIDERVAAFGADGKLVLDGHGSVRLVNLLEKLLVPLLSKLGNLVVDGGIWLNTQRPEWNDANNALVGQGLSMVTLYYMRRYVNFLQGVLEDESGSFAISGEVANWLTGTSTALASLRAKLDHDSVDDEFRYQSLVELGRVASDYRTTVYAHGLQGAQEDLAVEDISRLLDDALVIIDRSIAANRRADGMYHAYNVAAFNGKSLPLEQLYPMLEGQVAALSAGSIPVREAIEVLDALFASTVYRKDQNSFMLYPDRDLPGFLERNRVPDASLRDNPELQRMLADSDERIVLRDADGFVRFRAEFRNARDVRAALDAIEDRQDLDDGARVAILELYETIFNHKAFTGRSGTMFGFEGLGSIYWHMVSKLLLAVEENFRDALDDGADETAVRRLGELYYKVRSGIGFNKTPAEYGAFPTDPYSHTPKHAGARQPGMTGQVKEEILTRFGELGIHVHDGAVTIRPALLRAREFLAKPREFRYLDVDNAWQTLQLPASSIAFTWCQVPVVYVLDSAGAVGLDVDFDGGKSAHFGDLALPAKVSRELFGRTGKVRKLKVSLSPTQLFGD